LYFNLSLNRWSGDFCLNRLSGLFRGASTNGWLFYARLSLGHFGSRNAGGLRSNFSFTLSRHSAKFRHYRLSLLFHGNNLYRLLFSARLNFIQFGLRRLRRGKRRGSRSNLNGLPDLSRNLFGFWGRMLQFFIFVSIFNPAHGKFKTQRPAPPRDCPFHYLRIPGGSNPRSF